MALIRTPIGQVHAHLVTIRDLLPHWETNQQIRETSDGTRSHGTPPPEMLPFGLDKTLDTEDCTATRDGAFLKLLAIKQAWEKKLGIRPVIGSASIHTITQKMMLLLPQAAEKVEVDAWNGHALMLRRLAQSAIAHSGRAPHVTFYPCLECGTLLEQDYTDEGRLEIYTCPLCEQYWTPDSYATTVKALAAYGSVDCQLTQTQAAELLHLPLGTVNQRIRRAGIRPAGGKGKNATYWLSDIKSS